LNLLPEDLVQKIKASSTQTLVFCPTQAKTVEIWEQLGEFGVLCGAYHSLLTQTYKEEVVSNLKGNKIKCVVATTALGWVPSVLSFFLSSSFFSYLDN